MKPLIEMIAQMDAELRKAFFADVNKDDASKAAFLLHFIGETVTLSLDPCLDPSDENKGVK